MLKGGGEKVFDTVTSGEGEGGKMHVWDGWESQSLGGLLPLVVAPYARRRLHSLGGVLPAAALSAADDRRSRRRSLRFELAGSVTVSEVTIADRRLAQVDDTVRTASTSLSSDAASSPLAGVGGKSSRRAA